MSTRHWLSFLGTIACLAAAHPAFAADPPQQADSIWGSIQYDDIQGTAASIDTTISVVFDNFIAESNSGDPRLTVRKLLGLSLPLTLPADKKQVTSVNAYIRGAFLRGEGEEATIVVVFGNETKTQNFPKELSSDAPDGDFLISLTNAEHFASGSSVPMTILLIARKSRQDEAVLLTVDSVDISAATE
jgi:hypothetical protein